MYLRSPINYSGNKYKILKYILPLFPKNINLFIDLFAGSCNVGLNVETNKIIFNDNLTFLIDLYKYFLNNDNNTILNKIDYILNKYNLKSEDNKEGFLKLRKDYNITKEPLKLFILLSYSFNYQIRFNNSHKFNSSYGKNICKYNKNIENNLITFLNYLHQKDIKFTSKNFINFDYSILTPNDFIYCDPPYLITTGVYNDGKRGFTGWNNDYELKLLNILSNLNNKNIRFALSNVIEHKEMKNDLLLNWINSNNFNIHYIKKEYKNSSYQLKFKKSKTVEVLITNY